MTHTHTDIVIEVIVCSSKLNNFVAESYDEQYRFRRCGGDGFRGRVPPHLHLVHPHYLCSCQCLSEMRYI